GFDSTIVARRAAAVRLTVDNVNLDMAGDVRRAVPAAAAIFAERLGLPGVRIRPELVNVLERDTCYVDYLGVSAIALARVIAGVLGALLRRTLPIAPLVLGIALPLYLDSGALEPQRFDGEALFWFAHVSPAYYGVGVLEHAFHGLAVTPEPVGMLLAVLAAMA